MVGQYVNYFTKSPQDPLTVKRVDDRLVLDWFYFGFVLFRKEAEGWEGLELVS